MINRFKGLDLIDRVPEELWREAPNTVQEVVIKATFKKKKCKKAEWLSEEALQIAEKTLSEINQTQQDGYYMIPLYAVSRQIHRHRK